MDTKKKKIVENGEYASMLRRMIRAYGRRVAAADGSDLSDLAALAEMIQVELATAARTQAACRSWAHVGSALGISRQAAFRKYADKNGVQG